MRTSAHVLALLALGCGASAPDEPVTALHVEGQADRTHASTTHTPSDPDRRAADRARCDDGDLAGCHAAALDAYHRPSAPDTDADAVRYFTRACDGGYMPSCNGLGVLHAEGRGVPEDDAEAARLYQLACAGGVTTACRHLAIALRGGEGVDADPDAADRAEARADCVFEASLGETRIDDCPPLSPSRSREGVGGRAAEGRGHIRQSETAQP